MNAGEIVYSALTGNAGVAALVSTRIYPEIITQDADLPAISYQIRLQDSVPGNAPVRPASVVINCVAHTDADAKSVASAVDAALNNFSGVSSGTRLLNLQRESYEELRDEEFNVWARTLTFSGVIIY